MPSGIILSSGSAGATKEAVEKVLTAHNLEIEKPAPVEGQEPTTEGKQDESVASQNAPEPKRGDFASEDEFNIAYEEWKVERDDAATSKAEADDDKDVDGDEGDESEPATPKLSKFKKRVNKLTAPLHRKIAELEAQIKSSTSGGAKKDEPAPTAAPARPLRASFKTQEEYEDALIAWGTEKTTREQAIKQHESDQRQQLESNFSSYKRNVEEFKDTVDDWDTVVNQPIPMHTEVQLAIFEQVNGAQVVYYLGKHPEYTKQLAILSPLSAVMEVGRLSERLLSRKGTGSRNGSQPASGSAGSSTGNRGTSTSTKVVKIPAPISPVSTAATSPALNSRDAASKRDFKAFKRAIRSGR